MNRVIFSLYIDIQKPVSHFDNKDKFNQNYSCLLERQQEYAELCGAEYKHFTYDDDFIEYSKNFGPEISEYNIINFYKMFLLYKQEHDEILYLDMDVIPVTKLNFFEEWDLSKGITVMSQDWQYKKETRIKEIIDDCLEQARVILQNEHIELQLLRNQLLANNTVSF